MNIRGIVCRQLFTGIWAEPSKIFLQKIRERKVIENEIAHLTGFKAINRENEAIYELSKDNLIREFKKQAS